MTTHKLNRIKLLFASFLLGYSIIGILLSLHYLFDLRIIGRDSNLIGWAIDNGGASNNPIFFGLTACAGAYLIASIKPTTMKE